MKSSIALTSKLITTDRTIDLEHSLFSGQTFRWSYSLKRQNQYYGFINQMPIILTRINSDTIEAIYKENNPSLSTSEDFISRFFTLDTDTNNLFSEQFKVEYPEVWRLVQPYLNVRVLRQDPFEVMVTFMCAQGIGMHLIRRQVAMIAEHYGEKVFMKTPDGQLVFHRFPSPSDLASADPDEMAVCTNNNRIRARNIIAMARSFESGALSLACVESGRCDLETLRETLCAHGGIGLKIADCIALFGLGRFDAFPIDTHVKQYLWEWFGIEEARRSLTEKNYHGLQEKVRAILGAEYAGYAGHILFHCWRKEVKKMKAF